MKFVMSYSGGKDSALALYRMIQKGHEPVALLTTLNPKQDRSWFHGIQKEQLEKVSESLSIPIIICMCEPHEYTEKIEASLKQAKDMGAKAAVFGDIDIEDHYKWNNDLCNTVGLECVLPLWQESREDLTYEFINIGFKGMIKIIQCNCLDESFLGEILSKPVVERIKATGSDVCGENGEYHTFVFDGPIFKTPLAVEAGDIVDFTTHKALDFKLK